MRKSLIIVPHPDDEVLAFGGYISAELSKGNQVRIIYATCGNPETQFIRRAELQEACESLGVSDFDVWFMGCDGQLNKFENRVLVGLIDRELDSYKPEGFLYCRRSRHVDHNYLWDCCHAALRIRSGWSPSFVAEGEYPYSLTEGQEETGSMLLPLTKEALDRKVRALSKHKSQFKEGLTPVSEYGVTTLARARGLEAGCEFAEKYTIIKLVKKYE